MESSIFDKLAETVTRRGFVGKLVTLSGTLALGLLAAPTASATTTVACCGLCQSSTTGCSGTCCWTWQCCYIPSYDCTKSRLYSCKECYSTQTCAADGCPSVCSQAIAGTFGCC
jgi:hypothetical protein